MLGFVCLLRQIDSNTDGLVDFTEFVAATVHVHQLEEHNSEKWNQRSQAAFEKFDVDRDGYITAEELRMVSIISSVIVHLVDVFNSFCCLAEKGNRDFGCRPNPLIYMLIICFFYR